ncbi:MAG: PEP-CTERM sorting domain-containing protein [Planctomycetaceae bacterium]|nr:PEP-CTERM sorting domain-containing protein [Planctomycetaceae bacterium]
MTNRRLGWMVAMILSLWTPAAFADVIYNSFRTADDAAAGNTTTGSTPRYLMGDDISTIATPDPNKVWLVDSMSLKVFVFGSGVAGQNQVYDAVTMRVRVFETFDASAAAGTSVFSNQVSDVTWNLGTITNNSATGGNQVFLYSNLPYLASNAQFELQTGQNIGVTVEFLSNGVINNGLATVLMTGAGNAGVPLIGTSTNGWYRDANSNGFLEASDRRTLTNPSNMQLIINATAVPEPTTVGLLLVGSIGIFVRRRR